MPFFRPLFRRAGLGGKLFGRRPRGFLLDRHDGAAHGIDFVINLNVALASRSRLAR